MILAAAVVLLAAPAGRGPHPAAILIGETHAAEAVNAAGFAAFRVAPRPAWPQAMDDVREAVHSLRQEARSRHLRPRPLVIVSAGREGYLGNLAGMLEDVQAVVTLAGESDFRGRGHTPVEETLLAARSPVMHIRRGGPPYLLIHGDRDDHIPLLQSTHWQNALQAAGIRCNLIVIPGGGDDISTWSRLRDWRSEMVDWLRRAAFGR